MVSQTLDEKIGREELPVGWPWRFFLFSFLVVVTAVVAYAGLAFGYAPFLASRIQAQDANFEQLGKIIPQKQQDQFIQFYSQLANLQGIMQNHVVISPLFGLLEARTNVGVQYTAFEARVAERKVLLEGIAASYKVFAEQLQAFALAPEIETVIVNDSNALEGRVRFRLTVMLK